MNAVTIFLVISLCAMCCLVSYIMGHKSGLDESAEIISQCFQKIWDEEEEEEKE